MISRRIMPLKKSSSSKADVVFKGAAEVLIKARMIKTAVMGMLTDRNRKASGLSTVFFRLGRGRSG